MKNPKVLVGWREWLRLPDLGIRQIKAKVDTGARTSALHAEDIHYFRRGRKQMVGFTVHPRQRNKQLAVAASAILMGERLVRSSSGDQELRPVIQTSIDVGGIVWPIELTLTQRDVMGFRMLLGRQALRGHAIIDPGRSFVTRRIKKKSARTKKPGSERRR